MGQDFDLASEQLENHELPLDASSVKIENDLANFAFVAAKIDGRIPGWKDDIINGVRRKQK